MSQRSIDILLIEDQKADVDSFRLCLTLNKLPHNLTVARKSEDALAILTQEGATEDHSFPDLIVLDLNLPGMDGREFLKIAKSDPRLRRIPIAVMTSSESDEDVASSYELGANCYIRKPIDFEDLKKITLNLGDFWSTTVILPPRNDRY